MDATRSAIPPGTPRHARSAQITSTTTTYQTQSQRVSIYMSEYIIFDFAPSTISHHPPSHTIHHILFFLCNSAMNTGCDVTDEGKWDDVTMWLGGGIADTDDAMDAVGCYFDGHVSSVVSHGCTSS